MHQRSSYKWINLPTNNICTNFITNYQNAYREEKMSFFCATKFIICIYIVQCILCTKPIFTESELLINVQNQVSDGINRIDEVDWFLLWIDMLRKIVWKIYANVRTVTWTPVHIAKSAQNKKNVESRYSTKFYLFNLSSSTCHS